MITTTELAVSITIWALTGTGSFFGIRAVLRKRKKCRSKEENKSTTQKNL